MASNSFTNSTDVAGYGEDTVSGTTVSDISYSTQAADASKLAAVNFTSTTDVTGMTAQLTVKDSTGTQIGSSPYACTLGTWDATNGNMTISCATSDNPSVSSVATVGLTVAQ